MAVTHRHNEGQAAYAIIEAGIAYRASALDDMRLEARMSTMENEIPHLTRGLDNVRRDVQSLGERVSCLERTTVRIESKLGATDAKMDAGFLALQTQMDMRFDAAKRESETSRQHIDDRFDVMDARFAEMTSELRMARAQSDARFEKMTTESQAAQAKSDARFEKMTSESQAAQARSDARFAEMALESQAAQAKSDARFAEMALESQAAQAKSDARFEKMTSDWQAAQATSDARFAEMKSDFRAMQAKSDVRFEEIKSRFDLVEARSDARFEAVAANFERANARFDGFLQQLSHYPTKLQLACFGLCGLVAMTASACAVIAVLLQVLGHEVAAAAVKAAVGA